ncbi:ribosomal protein S18 acetylase RimI-like enzyme [Saccharothrix tamanrassetensis]|uniref:Ribosomal protein S18 acetylase RimI-like enzyme n=1 Tax=Saccharothrix tamanrassetensis TaxID=1051531 RepID=A0A841CPH5_9PSEU|nr:GNAT family N-acetyltransferase [Saccharothrix tamanrassetensis]MBB5960332.1 ribosomal protein S18 acetylase RimI-like enzyme [Saccharothrix tamanrassetensis]
MDLHYRPISPADDLTLDDSFTTDTVFEVRSAPLGFQLEPTPVDPPLRKVFPPDDDDPPADGFVAVDDELRGFISVEIADWHRRLVVRQLTVAPSHRGRGVGRRLMELALDHGRDNGARTVWLETSNVNVPAIRAYQRMGFALAGLDTTLYRGTPAEGEVALYLAKPL